MSQEKLLLPEYLVIALRQIGMPTYEFTLWQHATDFLREKHSTHIVIYPHDRDDKLVYDYEIWSPFGEDWQDDSYYSEYYEALEAGIEEGINGVTGYYTGEKDS